MERIHPQSIDGKLVTDSMIDGWSKSLDNDEWPDNWINVGPIYEGLPTSASDDSVAICVKVPVGLKAAVQKGAKEKGISTSDAIRCALSNWVLASA